MAAKLTSRYVDWTCLSGSTDFLTQNTIICCTSNLGSDILADPSSTGIDGVVTETARQAVLGIAANYFPPELINRLDSQIVFNRLSRQSIYDIVSLRLRDVSDRLKDRRIHLDVDPASREWLAREGYSEVYGARAVARIVRQKVVNPLAEKLLLGTIRCAVAMLTMTWIDISTETVTRYPFGLHKMVVTS